MANLKAFRNNKSLSSDGKAIFMVFFGAIIAVVLIGTFADNVFTQTNTYTWTNETYARPTVNTSTDLTGRELVGSAIVLNSTVTNGTAGGGIVTGAIVSTGTSASTGLRSVQILLNDTAHAETSAAGINVTYTFRPDGYLNLAGARGMASLIVIMSALAILVFVVVVFIKYGTLGRLIGRG